MYKVVKNGLGLFNVVVYKIRENNKSVKLLAGGFSSRELAMAEMGRIKMTRGK